MILARESGRGARALRAIAALAVLAGLLAGVPVLLYVTQGAPLPERAPGFAELIRAVSRPDDGTLLVAGMQLIAWAAWASFVASFLIDIAARLRGHEIAPRLPGLGLTQKLAAGLITSVALAVALPSTAGGAAAPPPVSAVAPPHPFTERAGQASKATFSIRPSPRTLGATDRGGDRSYRVKRGDSLSGIAKRKLGSAKSWPRIWRLNAHRRQLDGRLFRNPNLIHPGWRLRLPIGMGRKAEGRERSSNRPPGPSRKPTRRASTRPPASTPLRTAVPPRPPDPQERSVTKYPARAVVTIELPSGVFVALSFAAGVSTALAATRLHGRRRRIPPPPSHGVTIASEAPPGPIARSLHRAHIRREFTDQATPAPSDSEIVRSAFSIDVPDALTLGVHDDGSPIEARLAGMNMGLTGPGAEDAVRAMTLALLTQSDHHRAEIITTSADAEALFGPLPRDLYARDSGLSGMKIVPSASDALRELEIERLTRARMMADHDAEDVDKLREADPGEVLPAVVLVMRSSNELRGGLAGDLTDCARYGVGAVIIGGLPSGSTCEVERDGHVVSASGPLAPIVHGGRLFHVPKSEGPELIRTIANGHDAAWDRLEEDDGPVEPTDSGAPASPRDPQGEPPVRLLIMGVPIVEVDHRKIPLGRRGKALELLIYLSLHPEGATREEICGCLWPDFEPGDRFHSTLRHLRDPLRRASGLRKALFVRAEGERYLIDPELVSVDLWDFQRALRTTRIADNEQQRQTALGEAVALFRGHLAQGVAYDWIDEERYPLTRAQCDALAQLAELIQNKDPDRALESLERARVLDPDNEETYRRIMRLQVRLERTDGALRTARLLRSRLDELGLEPQPETRELFAELQGRPSPSKLSRSAGG